MIRLKDCDSPFGTITILKAKSTGVVIYEQGGCYQSEADSNGTSLASYIHAIFGLIWQAKAQSVLMIGCAGGTLGTMLARAGLTVTIVDENPASFPLARQYFDLPDSVEREVADGREFLFSNPRAFDVIVLDAYHGDRFPAHLQSQDFFRLIRSRLSVRGAVFANIHVAHDFDDSADRVADCMASVWSEVRLLDTQGLQSRNAIVMAGAVAGLNRPYLLVPPESGADGIDAELAMMRYRTRQITL